MPVQTYEVAPGVRVKLGRVRPKARPQVLRLKPFLELAGATPPPPSVDYTQKAMASVKRMYANDQYGCCVISDRFHSVGIWTGNDTDSGGCQVGTDDEVVKQYHQICGPGDNGCVITQVLDYMKANGLNVGGKNFKLDGYVAVTWTDPTETKVALYLFGGLVLGINLPKAWLDAPEGGVWDVTSSRIVGGHDVRACFAGDTKVPLLDGTERTMRELASGVAGESFWVYSCDGAGNVVPGLAHSARKTGEGLPLVKVTLDNGEQIRCTADHPFMLRDGTYREAGKLRSGDSLMPLYRKTGTKQMKGYEQTYNPATKKWRFTHRLVAASARGGRYVGDVVHHKDFNKRNNAPGNLEVMSWEEHTRLHSERPELLEQYAKSEAGRAKSRELMRKLWADPEWRARMVKQLGENGRAACKRRAAEGRNGTQTWSEEKRAVASKKSAAKARGRKNSEEHKRKSAEGLRRRFATDEAFREKNREVLKKAVEASARQQRAGLTDAQREARRKNIQVALAKMQANRAARSVAKAANNHKVVSVEADGREDVYDLTVDKHHNFAMSAGVFVHNCGYNDKGVVVSTWGGLRTITWAAFTSKKWLEECYCELAPAWYNADNLAPSGVNVVGLKAALAQLADGGIPPIPPTPLPPGPVPPPTPPPPTPVPAPLFSFTANRDIPKGGRLIMTLPVPLPAGKYDVTEHKTAVDGNIYEVET